MLIKYQPSRYVNTEACANIELYHIPYLQICYNGVVTACCSNDLTDEEFKAVVVDFEEAVRDQTVKIFDATIYPIYSKKGGI